MEIFFNHITGRPLKAVAFGLLAAATLAGTPEMAAAARIDVDAIARYVYPGNVAESPRSFTYLPDGESYLLLSKDGKSIGRYETATGKLLETVLDVTHTRENSVQGLKDLILSPDGSKLLLYTEKHPVYRRSFRADWHVFEIKRNILRPLSVNFKLQQAPLFSPAKPEGFVLSLSGILQCFGGVCLLSRHFLLQISHGRRAKFAGDPPQL